MRLSRITGVVFIGLAVGAFWAASGIPEKNKPVGYAVAAVFLVIGLWRLFAPKGH